MGLDLATLNTGFDYNAPAIQEAFESTTSGGNRLPKLSLKTSNSEACKEGKTNINSYALEANEKLTDIGKEITGLVVGFRAFALDFSDKENIVLTGDANSEDYKRIKAVVDSNKKESGCMCGPEFLIYLPEENTYTQLFMGGWNAKLLGADSFFNALKGKYPVTIGSTMKEGKHGKNFYPTCEQLTTDIDLSGTDEAELIEKVTNFMEITKPALELDEAEDDDER